MAAGFVIAIMLCAGDNCDMVQAEPGVSYPTYEACSAATAGKQQLLADIAEQYGAEHRPADIICLRELQRIASLQETYEAPDNLDLRAEPSDAAPVSGRVAKGQRVVANGQVVGTPWIRVQRADGGTGFVQAGRLRKLVEAAARPPEAGGPPVAGGAPGAGGPPAAGAAQTRPAAPLRNGEFRDCGNCAVMVPLPGGTFAMGSNDDATERPVHHVAVRAFAIGKFEVTEAEWGACVAGGGCSYKRAPSGSGAPEHRPMENLSWTDAVEYTGWLQKVTGKPYRLPSEAEWEYAARAGTAGRYSWGNGMEAGKADCAKCGTPYDPRRPTDSGSFAPNPWALYDMSGSVAEWTLDCWHPNYLGAPGDGAPWYGTSCERHVLRGGSWMNPPSDVTVSARNFYDGSVRYVANGLRVALTLP